MAASNTAALASHQCVSPEAAGAASAFAVNGATIQTQRNAQRSASRQDSQSELTKDGPKFTNEERGTPTGET
jgi:hypothetical protein